MHFLGIEPDSEVGLDVSSESDIPYSGEGGDEVFELVSNEEDFLSEVGPSGESRPEDGLVLGVRFSHDWGVNANGE